MRLPAIKTALTRTIGRQILITQKNSPVLLAGTGIVGIVTAVVLSNRATLKLDEVLKETEEKLQLAKQVKERTNDETYSEEDLANDIKLVRVKAAVKICKLYAPSVIIGVVSIAALTGSHVILTRRNVGLTAAYAAIDKGFRQYRERVVQEFGAEKDAELRFGVVEKTIAVDTNDGPVPQTVRMLDTTEGKSMYARCFDENNPKWRKTPYDNQTFIQVQQNYANDLLKANGFLFLNDVYEMLGFPKVPEGQIVGWLIDPDSDGDSYVDFGVFMGDLYQSRLFVNGDERSTWLDFNVDGPIYELIGKKKGRRR